MAHLCEMYRRSIPPDAPVVPLPPDPATPTDLLTLTMETS